MASATNQVPSTYTVVQEQEGAALLERNGVFTVTDGDGEVKFEGGEVGAEFKYWETVFGVDDGEEQAL